MYCRNSRETSLRSHALRSRSKQVLSAAAALACLPLFADHAYAITPLTLDSSAGGTETYTQNFDSIGATSISSSGTTPTGFSGVTGATATALGTSVTSVNAGTFSATAAGFYNVASADNSTSTDTAATQNADTNRALGLQPTSATGYDPGSGIELELSNTTNLTNFNLSFELQLVGLQTRVSTYSIQYGIGSNPTSFTTLGTYVTPGSFGITNETFNASALAGIANQSTNVFLRIVALTASTGSGSRSKIALDDFSLSYTAPAAGTPTGVLVYDPAGPGAPAFTTSTGVMDFIDSGSKGDVAFANGNTVTFDNTGISKPNIAVDAGGVAPSSVTVSNTSGTYVFSGGAIGGSGPLTMSGAGTVVLSNANTYSGGTNFNAGLVQVSNDNNLGTGGLFFAGGTLETTAGITSAKPISISTAATINTDANTDVFTGGLAGAVSTSLTKLGTGSLTIDLTASGNTIGALNVSSGALTIDSTAQTKPYLNFASATVPSSVAANSTLYIGSTATNQISLEPAAGSTVGGTGAIVVSPGSSIDVYNSGTATFAPSIVVTTDGTNTSVLGGNSSGRTLVLNGAIVDSATGPGAVTFGGNAGTGYLAGKVILNGVNTYSGGTSIVAGTVVANSSNALGSGAVSVGSFASTSTATGAMGTLVGSGTISAPVTINTGGRISAGSGITTTDTTGALTTGTTTLSSGGTYVVKLKLSAASPAAAGTGGSTTTPGTVNDELILDGLSAPASAGFVITPLMLTGGVFGSNYSFLIAVDPTAGSIGDFSNLAVTQTGYTLSEKYVSGTGDELILDATGVPEPASALFLGALASPMLLRRRRRNDARKIAAGISAAGEIAASASLA